MSKTGRNDPCPCGSGKKYKHCCWNKNQQKVMPAMPGSPREHDLKRESTRHVMYKLPSRWPCQPVEDDYGKDLLVEINEGGYARALEFRIQVKGHERFKIVHSDQIAQPLEVYTLNYYDKLPLPVLLVVYSARDKQAHYLWVKPYIREVLDVQEPNWRERDRESEITLHVPLRNVFDETAHQDIWEHVEAETSKMLMQSAFPPSLQQPVAVEQLAVSPRIFQPKITNYLHRPRLTEGLSSAMAERTVFIHTDAGYGKTWLIQDFIATINPSSYVWYTFNKDAVGALQFTEELASEVLRRTNSAGARTLTYLHSRGREARPDEALAILVDEIQSSDCQTLLVIEDMHYISDNRIALLIESLVMSRPSKLQIILTSRLPLPFGQTKLIAQDLLTVMERSEVAFRLDETREYLERNLGLTLTQEQMQRLHERTSGWIAAIGLAGSALQQVTPDNVALLFERLTGFDGNIYSFFAEEVYAGLVTEIQWLLKRLGLVRIIQPEIVDLFTQRSDGGLILKELTKRNTFLIENGDKIGSYRLHSLFAEFLETRFQDEEGIEAVRHAHSCLAHHYSEQHDWYPATKHAIAATEYDLAIHGLEIIAPVAVNIGYGYAVLTMMEEIPTDQLEQSASLQELRGRAALHLGELSIAQEAFNKAKSLYQVTHDESALNRLEYFIAEVGLSSGEVSPEDFVRVAHRVASNCYKRDDIFVGSQVELRLIEIGQTLTVRYGGLLKELIERSEKLVTRLEEMSDDEYALIKARAFADQAHLLFEVVTFAFTHGTTKVHIRLQMGHQVPKEERVASVKALVEGWQHVTELYTQAEDIAKGKSDIQWAQIRLRRVNDYAHHLSSIQLVNAKLGIDKDPLLTEAFEAQNRDLFKGYLSMFQECAEIFAKYRMTPALAKTYCDAADLYDILGDLENRNKLAQEALELAQSKQLTDIPQRAQKLLRNESTFSSLIEQIDNNLNDKHLASLDEESKKQYVGIFLEAYAEDADIETMRTAVEADLNDMVSAAKQRLEWCRHVQFVEDLQHTRSVATMYRTIPKKQIVCMELRHTSIREGYSFDELWPMFKGIYCLGCTRRSLA